MKKTKTISIIVTAIILFSVTYILKKKSQATHIDVICHYTHIDKDTLKLKAAKFLLENIPYHYSENNKTISNTKWEHWRSETDIILKKLQAEYGYDAIPHKIIDSIRIERDSMPFHETLINSRIANNILCDSSLITDKYLIEHIDNAFEVWQTNKFAKKLSFDNFKEYILPYSSLQYYNILNNGKELHDIFISMLCPDSTGTLTECIKRYNQTIGDLRGLNGSVKRKERTGIYDMYVRGIHDCTDIAVWACNILRACGIPIVVENVIGYRDFVGRHFHCSVFDCDSTTWSPFNAESSLPGNFSFDQPKCLNVHRHLFATQRDSPYFLKGDNENVPIELNNPCIKDVTSLYRNVYKISLPCDISSKNKLAYLATFDAASGIKPVTWGVIDTISKSVTFENTLPEILYFPVYYNEDYQSFSTPFYLVVYDGKVDIKEIQGISDDTLTSTLYLTRKYPRKENMKRVAEGLIGGQFLGSNTPDFKDADFLFTIKSAPNPMLSEYKFKKIGKYKYYRFQAHKNNPHANISHLEWVTNKSYGYENTEDVSRLHILSPKEKSITKGDNKLVKLLDRNRNRMTWAKEYDGNMQTAPGAYPNITLSLDEPQIVTSVRFSPLNADNGIKNGNTYELFYWDGGWISCGIKVAEYEYIQFDSVPKNKLYWLDNITEGKEEMPFIIVNGKQKFVYDEIITN